MIVWDVWPLVLCLSSSTDVCDARRETRWNRICRVAAVRVSGGQGGREKSRTLEA